jgi:hypothetical protein
MPPADALLADSELPEEDEPVDGDGTIARGAVAGEGSDQRRFS